MESPLAQFVVIADAQFGDKDKAQATYPPTPHHPQLTREQFFRESVDKVHLAVDEANRMQVGLVQLGDIIDGNKTPEKTAEDFNTMLSAFSKHDAVQHVLGNHCLRMPRDQATKGLFPHTPNHQPFYLTPLCAGWSLIFLDTTFVSVKGNSEAECALAAEWLREHNDLQRTPNASTWNGAVGSSQRGWLREQLQTLRNQKQKAILFGHMPLLADSASAAHLCWDNEEVLNILHEFADVAKVYMCGHYHVGGYGVDQAGVHHVTVEAALEAPVGEACHGLVQVFADRICIVGRGGVSTRTLPIH